MILPQSATNLAIWLANLLLWIRVHTTLLASIQLALWKKIFLWRWYCGKKTNRKVVYRGLYSYRQRVLVITLFPNIFFALFLHVERVLKNILTGKTGKSDAYKELICIKCSACTYTALGKILTNFCRYLWYCGCASWVHNILTTVLTRIVVDKSTHHAKPHSIC